MNNIIITGISKIEDDDSKEKDYKGKLGSTNCNKDKEIVDRVMEKRV